MLTFYDEKGNGYGAQVEFTTKNAVNGERSVSGTILSNDKVLSKIDRGWSFDWDGETYKIIYAKPKDEGRSLSVSFDAVHQFFYDFDHSNCYQVFNGSNRFEVYIEAIFRGSGYRYQIETQANAIRKENFGNAKRLSMFKDVIKAAGLEFSVAGKVVRIVKKVGTDLSTVVRKNFNMNELTLEKNIGNFITYKKGLGAWKNEENHDAGRYETEYESLLARIYGRIEGEPISDERYKDTGKLLERLKHDVDNSYSISVQLEMEDLTRAGYKYTQPRAGDYIMAINEMIGFREKIRIVSYESSYDVTGRLIKHKVTCNDIGTVQKAITSEGSIMRSVGQSKEYAESALAIATKALVSADGKATSYYGAEKPRDQPRGTLHRGDLLYLTVGEETELYFWNGAEWELKHLKFDSSKLEKMFTDSKTSTDKAIAEANKRVEEALRNAGASSSLAQEAKRIGLDSVAKLEEFKRQATSAQTALSGDLDVLKRTIANEIRPKQAKVETEIANQIEALTQTKNELAGVKSAQATYEESTARRLSELANVADGKASKSELTQTAEELASKLASVQASGRNLFLNSLFKKDISKTGIWTTSTYTATIDSENKYLGHNALKIIGQNPSGRDGGNPKITYPAFGRFGKVVYGSTTNQDVTITFYARANKNGIMLRSCLGNIGYKNGNVILSTEIKRYVVHIPKSWTNGSVQTTNEWLFNFNQEGTVWIWMPKFEISDVDTSYSEAPEDIEGQISAVESNFRQRADSLDAGVSRLTEGLRTKADISSLNMTAENIKQSVKQLETITQNKLDQKLSMAEFEVRAGSIQQEILNVSKDKADKTLVVAEAGKLREEFSNLRVGGRNLIRNYDWNGLLPLNIISSGWKFERVEDQFAKSGYMLKATCTKAGNGGFHKVFFDLRPNEFQGKDMTWSWDMKSSRPTTFYDMGFEAGGLKRNVPVSTEWTRITNTFKVALNRFYSCVFYANGWQVGDVVYIRDPQLEEGTIATSPKPAPEDTDGLITEAKATFERTAQGLRTDLSAIQTYVDKDGQRQEELKSYARNETITRINIYRQDVARNYILRSRYDEDAKSIRQQFEAITNSQNGLIATKIADYKHSIDGKFTDISSQITTYKQDVGGQISGLSNRLTSSEQGTTTQISNLKTQVATNKDNAERQMGRISDQVSANKANADSQFANVTSQLARKVEITDFQRVRETSQLYERILGNTENGIADKVARMAMTSQLFQVEVSKASASGRNLFLNSLFKRDLRDKYSTYKLYDDNTQTKGQLAVSIDSDNQFRGVNTLKIVSTFNGKFDNQKITFSLGGNSRTGRVDELKNKSVRFNFWAKSTVNNTILQARPGYRGSLQSIPISTDWKFYDIELVRKENSNATSELILHIFTAATVWIAFPNVEIGTESTPFSEAPEDTDEAIRSVQSQLAGSWAVQNINSAGDLISGINLGANGHNRFVGKLTHITGETLIDKAVIKDGMIANVSANKLTAGTIDARTVNLVNLNANNVTSGTFRGLTFEGGIIRGNNGNTVINLNDNVTTYNGYAKIEFKSPRNSLEFNSGGRKAFLAPTVSQDTNYAAFAFGVNDRGDHDPNRDFVGLKIFNQPDSRQVEIVGDLTITRYEEQGIRTTSLRSLFKLIDDNFKMLKDFRVRYGEGSPGFYDIRL